MTVQHEIRTTLSNYFYKMVRNACYQGDAELMAHYIKLINF